MALWVRYEGGFGTLEGDTVQPHAGFAVQPHEGDLFAGPRPVGAPVPLAEVALLPPVRPGCFVGLWNNFHAAAAKQGNTIPEAPLYFLKSPGSIVGPEAPIRPPAGYAGRVIYEGELGIVIGRECSAVDEATAEAAIFGYTCVNDVTALDLLHADPSFPQWARAKGCDSFGPVGPAVATGLDWSTLRVTVALNGRVRQDYLLSDIILPPARIVALISREMTLRPGDLIACGTSLGALPMRPGMLVEVTIEGIGTLRNPYAPEEATVRAASA